jgi:hypothetical protein
MSGTKATFAKSAAVTAGFAAGLFDPSKTVTAGSNRVVLAATFNIVSTPDLYAFFSKKGPS